MTSPKPTDRIFRAMTNDGTFRVVTLDGTQTARAVCAAQQVRGTTARHLAELVLGSALIRETMSPQLRVQGILRRSDGKGYLLGDSHPSGNSRGLFSRKHQNDEFDMKNSVLQMVRTLQDGRVQQGLVSVADNADVSQALMTYMQESEQIVTMIVVGAVLKSAAVTLGPDEPDWVVSAGGYLVQLLPQAEQAPLAVMTERLEDFRNIDHILTHPEFTPRALCEELLYGMPFTELGDSELGSECWCSRTSLLGALATINRADVQGMVESGEILEVTCDYCRETYKLAPSDLQGLLDPN
jgi:molecular chaperone Hsp33